MSQDDRFSQNPMQSPPPRLESSYAEEESLPSLAGGKGGGLGSLANEARGKTIRNAKWTMIVIGILTVLVQLAVFFLVQGQIETELRKVGIDPANPPAEVKLQIAAAYAIAYGIAGIFLLLGVVFVILGVLTPKYPVPCTVTGLVLYILGWIVSGLLDPMQFVAGLIVKIIVIVCLFKAIQAAWAYQSEVGVSGQ